MMQPRQLTWLHLLPADSTFQTVSSAVPSWLRELEGLPSTPVRAAAGATLVEFDSEDADPGRLMDCAAFVGINCRKLPDSRLETSGMSRIDRYAVLPSWENPRWFIPLASPCVSSAGFDLYTPAKTSARLKRFAARVAVYSRVPFWYRDELLIARREPSPLENTLARLFPNETIHFALSAGAPEGARNRKASAAVIDSRGTILAFLKLAASDLAKSLLHREADVLRSLATKPTVAGLVPSLLSAGDIDGTFVTAQAPLAGGPAPVPITAMHWKLLDQLTSGERSAVTNTELVRKLPGRIGALPQPHPELGEALEEAVSSLADQRIATGAIHGDFAPWNLRMHHGRITAFDWEYGCLEGPAGLDEIHYRLQVGYLLNNWTIETAFDELAQSTILDRYLSRPGQPARVGLIGLYLVDVLTRLYAEGYDHANEMVEWNQGLLGRLAGHGQPGATKEAVLA